MNASNAGNYDFHLAIHTNAAPANLAGRIQGPDVYYYRDSPRSKAAAEIFANNLKLIYPQPEACAPVVPTTSLVELRRTKAPAVLVEVAYHDNVDDANWITSNIEEIAENLPCRLQMCWAFLLLRFKAFCLTILPKDVIIELKHNTKTQKLNGD